MSGCSNIAYFCKIPSKNWLIRFTYILSVTVLISCLNQFGLQEDRYRLIKTSEELKTPRKPSIRVHVQWNEAARERALSKSAVASADAIVVDVNSDDTRMLKGNAFRTENQLFVFWSMNNPGTTLRLNNGKNSLQQYDDNFFNATMTYRRDSTFYTQFANINHLTRPVDLALSSFNPRNSTYLLSEKKKLAIFVDSDCSSGIQASQRTRLVYDMLENGLDLDLYGSCFGKKEVNVDKREFLHLLETYKFYFAFENSLHCHDYITGRFFVNGLLVGNVPVVYGAPREDYEAIAPPHSFIHVEDFKTTGDLVEYLNYLDRNETAYAKYFEWRSMSSDKLYPYGRYMGFCALCRSLYGISLNDKRSFVDIYGGKGERYQTSVGLSLRQSVPSISEWWYDGEPQECFDVM